MNRVLLRDPGLQRTLLAGRVTLSLILGTLAGWATGKMTGQPGTLMMLSAVTAMQTGMVTFGAAGKGRMSAALYAWLIAAAATALAIAVTPAPVARYVAFVIVMIVAVWVRRFPPHGFGLGMMAFNAFFFPVFMRAKPSQFWWLLLYLALGVAAATVVRLLVLPDRPRRTLQQLIGALRERCTQLADGELDDGDLQRTMRSIDEIVLQVHELLESDANLVADEQNFQTHLFAVVSLSQLLVMQQGSMQSSAQAMLAPIEAHPVTLLFKHLTEAEQALVQRITEGDRPVHHEARAEEPGNESSAEDTQGLRDSDRAAIQVGLAAIISIAIGTMLSEQRWYWAAMTAFYMFINVTHRGVGLRRAVDRTIGTAAGIAGGLLLSYVLAGHPMIELTLLFPVLFVGFWMLKSSYAVMTVMITIMLALMYEMMGMLTFGLLLLRLGETFIGAGVGVAAMYFVLPARTSDAVNKVYEQYFDAVDSFLAALCDAATKRVGVAGDSVDAVSGLARAVGTIETTTRPLMNAVPGRRARKLRQELVLSLTIRYALHRLLARVVFHSTPLDTAALRARAAEVRATLSLLRSEGLSSESGTSHVQASNAVPVTPETALLSRVEALLGVLMQSRNQPLQYDPGLATKEP